MAKLGGFYHTEPFFDQDQTIPAATTQDMTAVPGNLIDVKSLTEARIQVRAAGAAGFTPADVVVRIRGAVTDENGTDRWDLSPIATITLPKTGEALEAQSALVDLRGYSKVQILDIQNAHGTVAIESVNVTLSQEY